MEPIRRRRVAAASLAALLALSACGSSDGAATEVPATDGSGAETPGSDAPTTDSGDVVLETSPSLTVDGAALPTLERDLADTAIGATAPVVTGQSFDGTEVVIGGVSEGPTMLVFLAHWCPHCNDEIPELLALNGSGDLPGNLNVVGISTAVDPNGDNYPPSEWIVDKGWDWAVLADTDASEAFQAFGGSGFPFTVMLDANGNVLARKSGSGTAGEINAWIEAALPTA